MGSRRSLSGSIPQQNVTSAIAQPGNDVVARVPPVPEGVYDTIVIPSSSGNDVNAALGSTQDGRTRGRSGKS